MAPLLRVLQRRRVATACGRLIRDVGTIGPASGNLGRMLGTGPMPPTPGYQSKLRAGSARRSLAFFLVGPDRPGSLRVRQYMDKQTKREIWLLAIGTILAEVPVVAIAAFVILSR
jgi:hypothetical protein